MWLYVTIITHVRVYITLHYQRTLAAEVSRCIVLTCLTSTSPMSSTLRSWRSFCRLMKLRSSERWTAISSSRHGNISCTVSVGRPTSVSRRRTKIYSQRHVHSDQWRRLSRVTVTLTLITSESPTKSSAVYRGSCATFPSNFVKISWVVFAQSCLQTHYLTNTPMHGTNSTQTVPRGICN